MPASEQLNFSRLPRQVCHALTRAGSKCTRYALPDNVFCRQHAIIGRAAVCVEGSFQAGMGLLWNNGTQPETVYHYTNVDSLRSIFDNRSLWLSRHDHLNDLAEISYGAGRLIEAARRFGGEYASLLADSVEGLADNLHNVFILSTSLHGDSLSLWRGYSGSDGVCIGFQPGTMRSMVAQAHASVRIGPDVFRPLFFSDLFDVRAGRVLYDPTEQTHYARMAIEQCVAHLTDPDPTLRKAAALFARDVLLTVLLLFKDPSFYQEDEYRICLVGREYAEDLALLPKSRSCTWSGSGELPYIELPLRLGEHLLRSIMAAPRFGDWGSTSLDLRARIERAGGDESLVEFSESEIPLRYGPEQG